MNKTASEMHLTQDALDVIEELNTENADLLETIEWLNCQLEAANTRGYTPKKLDGELIALIKQGKYIGAIKHYRDATGASLKEGKEYCDRIRGDVLLGLHGEIDPSLYHYLR